MTPDPGEAYQDDQSIDDGELLYRMITGSNTKFDAGVAIRPQTNAFQDRRLEDLPGLGVPATGVSIYIESEMKQRGVTPTDLVDRWGERYGVASLTAGDARAHGQGIVRWPQPDNPEHGMVFVLVGPKKTNGQSKNLAKAASIVVAPPPP